MDSEQVEIVARALANDTDEDWAAMPELHKLTWRSYARAAIAAYRPLVIEECAKVAEEDRRSDLAKDCGYWPEWQRQANRIATALRSMKEQTDG